MKNENLRQIIRVIAFEVTQPIWPICCR